MSSFEGITEFIAVAETHGFTSAAKRLSVSTSHVSRRIAELEARLGVTLVSRTTRSVRLTQAGQLYFERCIELVNGLEQANQLVTDEQIELSGVLRVSAAGEFAETHISPALVEFAAKHPKLKLQMHFSTRIVNFVEDRFDFAIRYGELSDSGLIARKLIDHEVVAAASPAYLEREGVPETPEQLRFHSCLVTNNNRWRFQRNNEMVTVSVNGSWRSNGVRSILHACTAGLGITYMPRTSYGKLLHDGTLKPVLEPYWRPAASTWIVYANRRYLPTRARAAIEFLLKRF
ncbi:LysR family transcriptional regulator [Flexibacterium corallicola]|uniref:LysR family transcriptional regulator n=1 Tax=Flexibacterium corallicola TaxID=3037259 RepID=UPI00286F85DF|nr:LysR family transcriptional regulator [Pseudovibrio sp. M1P-2-3]